MHIGVMEWDVTRLGGRQRTMLVFADYLKSRGHTVTFYSNPPGPQSNYLADEFLTYCNCPWLAYTDLEWWDLVQDRFSGFLDLGDDALVARLARHDVLFTATPMLGSVKRVLPDLRVISWAIHPRLRPGDYQIDVYWTNCATTRRRLISRPYWQPCADRIRVVFPPHDYSAFRAACRPWQDRVFDVVMVGAVAGGKGLIEFDAVCQQLGVRSLIIGARRKLFDPQTTEDLLARVIHSELVFDVSLAEVAAYLGNSRVYLCTSKQESCPLVIYEALNAGCAIVARNVGGILDQIGNHGQLFVEDAEAPALVRAALETPPEGARARGYIFDRVVVGAEVDDALVGALSDAERTATVEQALSELAVEYDLRPETVGRKVSIIVKTFERPDCLRRLLESIRKFYPDVPVFVADDSRVPQQPIVDEQIHYYTLPFDSGAAAGRNLLMQHVTTPYVVKVDDDFVFVEDTGLLEAVGFLEYLGADLVAGTTVWADRAYTGRLYLRQYEGVFKRCGTGGIDLSIRRGVCGEEGGYPLYELVTDFYLGRADVLREHGWDEEIKVCGLHYDFFLRAQDRGLKISHLPSFRVLHLPERSPEYEAYRTRLQYLSAALRKHDVRYIVPNPNFHAWIPFDQTLDAYAPWIAAEMPLEALPPDKTKVLLIYDAFGWAAETACQQLALNLGPEFYCSLSKRTMFEYAPGDELYDIVYVHCSYGLKKGVLRRFRDHNPTSKLLVGVRGWMGLRAIQREVLALCDGVNVNNTVLQDTLREWEISAHLCYAGVDADQFRPLEAGYKSEEFVVGWAGDTQKPVKRAAEVPTLGFFYMLAAPENANFPYPTRQFSHEEMPYFYNAIDVLVLPSWHSKWPVAEGCPVPVLEAAACGKPVLVSSKAGAAVDLLDDFQVVSRPFGRGGLEEMRFKLEYLRCNPSFAAELGTRNRQAILAEWTWRDVAKQYAAFFREALKR